MFTRSIWFSFFGSLVSAISLAVHGCFYFAFTWVRRRCCELLSISDLSFFGLCFPCSPGGVKGPGVYSLAGTFMYMI
jgi:hypothetical protein